MVNLSKVATNYKITPQQAITHFDSAIFTSIKNLSSGVKIIESNVNQNVLASITARKNRERIHGFINADGSQKYKGWGQKFVAGDIMRVNVEKGPYAHLLEGLCLSIKKRSFLNKDTVVLVRNVLFGVGVEITASYYNNRLYKCGFSDYKRKQFEYVNHKLYYLRQRDNRETQI
ncbi:MAG: 50S ribosomal protein L19 [Rickettsiales bacterium]|nr:MAG: 50S ribosomal protein L19 [Rickettsiales bacterium]